MTVPSPPRPDATQAEIEADIVATRTRLAGSLGLLADRVDVKARAQEKVDEAKTAAQAKVSDVKATAQAKAVEGREKVVLGYQEVRRRVLALPRPAQVGLAAVPALVVALLIARKVRS